MRLWMVMLALPLAGCAALKAGDSPTVMRLSPTFAAGQQLATPSIAVAPVQARGLAGATRYAYVDAAAAGEIRQAASYFWEEAPATVLERALVAGLRTRFTAVNGPQLSVVADRRLVATLDRFEEVTGVEARAVVAFDATLVAQGKAIWAGRACGTAPVGGADGTSRARAFTAAMEQAVGALVQDVAAGSVTAAAC
jgi:ABC-type uncharacterized transport system auxiliary subunit